MYMYFLSVVNRNSGHPEPVLRFTSEMKTCPSLNLTNNLII